MKPWRLTPQAEQSLVDIAAWTFNRFGEAQSLAYRDALINRLDALAVGSPPHPRSCGLLMQGRAEAKALTYYREGGHFIIMRETEKLLEVIEFLHESSNLPDLIEKLK